MLRVPGAPSLGKRTSALVEAVDLFPTLAHLAAGQSGPIDGLDGVSIAPIVADPAATVKKGAYSEFVKCYSCCRVPDDSPCEEGGTAGRCAPTTAAGLADLHEMGNCFHVPREEIGEALAHVLAWLSAKR